MHLLFQLTLEIKNFLPKDQFMQCGRWASWMRTMSLCGMISSRGEIFAWSSIVKIRIRNVLHSHALPNQKPLKCKGNKNVFIKCKSHKIITRDCHLLDPRWNVLYLDRRLHIIKTRQNGLFLINSSHWVANWPELLILALGFDSRGGKNNMINNTI